MSPPTAAEVLTSFSFPSPPSPSSPGSFLALSGWDTWICSTVTTAACT
jgi:hypothetical protein